MSKIRGILPLFLATSFGVYNGMIILSLSCRIRLTLPGFKVFDPSLKEYQQQKEEQAG
jgi:hypothetical protein